MTQLVRPVMPIGAVLLGQGAPGREVVEAAALPLAERGVRQVSARRALNEVHRLQGGALDLPYGVTIDEPGFLRTCLRVLLRLADAPTVADVGEFGDRLDPQVQSG